MGLAGGPCFNEIGQCVGIAFQSLGHGEADGIGYVIPTPVINHFLTDYRCAATFSMVWLSPFIEVYDVAVSLQSTVQPPHDTVAHSPA